MKRNPKSFPGAKEAAVALLVPCLLLPVIASAQSEEGEVFELSPFTVEAEQDSGYVATSTLSGTRLATNLRDTAGSLSIMTPEMMEDLNVTSIEDAILYFPSGNQDLGSPVGGGAQAGNTIRANPDTRKVRGISTQSSSRNFFPVAGSTDFYNSERLTSSNGPNSILFGTGGVEGVAVSSTKRANTQRNFGEIVTRFDSEGSLRGAFDGNLAVNPKLAVRVNALAEDGKGFRENETMVQRRAALAGTFRPREGSVMRIDYESFLVERNAVPLKWAMDSGYQSWLTAGKPLIDELVTGGWSRNQRDQYSDVLSQSGRGVVFMGNLPGAPATLNKFRLGETIARPFGNGSVQKYQVPDPVATYGISREANLMPGTKSNPHNTKEGYNVSAFFEQRVTSNLFIEVAGNRTREDMLQRSATMDEIQVDPNRYLTDGSLNPGYQQLYAETAARQVIARVENEGWRATASYELQEADGLEFLGHHRFAALWETNLETARRSNEFVVNTILDGSNGLNRNPRSGQNRLRYRSYYFPQSGDVRPYTVYDVFDQPSLADVPDPLNPGQYLYKFSVENVQGQSISEIRQDSLSAVWQGYFLKDRLVTTYGYRDDSIGTWGLLEDELKDGGPYYKRAIDMSLPGSQAANDRYSQTSSTFGAVGHVTDWLSLAYNQSEVFNPPVGLSGLFSADGSPLGPETGETQELGVRFYLLDDRLTVNVNRYEAATKDTNQFNPANRDFIGRRNNAYQRMQENWADSGLVTDIPPEDFIQRDGVRGLTDTDLNGWELTTIFNPTSNWRILVTGSVNETIESNRYTAIKELVANDIVRISSWSSQLEALSNSPDQDLAARAAADLVDINANLLGLTTALNDANATEGRDLASVGKYALNFVSSYLFEEGLLANWRLTGRARYRSAPVIGYERDSDGLIMINSPVKGDDFLEAGAQVGRKFKLDDKRVLDVRLDVSNLFNSAMVSPQIADTDDWGVFGTPGEMRVIRWAFQRPRAYTLTVGLEF